MTESEAVRGALRGFYRVCSARDPAGFADVVAAGERVGVIVTGPDEATTIATRG